MRAKVRYQSDVRITALGPDFYDPVSAAKFAKPVLRFRNCGAAKTVGLNHLSKKQWRTHFARFKPLPDNLKQPLALRYHGHQFQHYNSELGDGRGFLFAQLRERHGRLLDLGTKGSGQTPYSRAGDGRLTLQGGVREVLATSYLEYLGVPTSKSFSLVETGESLQRHDEPSPARSCVLVRLSHSHIRFGTFQRAAFEKNTDGLKALTEYCLENYYPDIKIKNPASLLEAATKSSAQTVASWMVAGFVHGVMNTDNMNITGESFDYGPFRFLPTLQPGFVAAYFDRTGLYAFGRQPEIMYWNLGQLALSLSLICDDESLHKGVESFPVHYRAALCKAFFARLGLKASGSETTDVEFVMSTFKWLQGSQAGLAQFYDDFHARPMPPRGSQNTKYYKGTEYENWKKLFHQFEFNTLASTGELVSLVHKDIETLWADIARKDDWALFKKKLAQMKVDWHC